MNPCSFWRRCLFLTRNGSGPHACSNPECQAYGASKPRRDGVPGYFEAGG